MGLTLIESIVISSIANGILCIMITLAIEKLGGALGGILGCIPSTLMIVVWGQWTRHSLAEPNALFPYISQVGFLKYQKTVMSIHPGMLLNSLYLFLWRLIPRLLSKRLSQFHLYSRLGLVFLTNISIWLCCTVCVTLLLHYAIPHEKSISIATKNVAPFTSELVLLYCISFVAITLAILIGVIFCWNPPSAPRGFLKTPWYIYMLRGLGTAFTTGMGLYVSGIFPYVGGIISVFPVIFTTAMISVWIQQGRAVSQGAIGPLMLGQTSTGIFIILMAFLPAVLNFYAAIVICFITCVGFVNIPAYFYLQWRMRMKKKREETPSGEGAESIGEVGYRNIEEPEKNGSNGEYKTI